MQKHENGRQHENKHETLLWNVFLKNFIGIHQVEQTNYCHCLTEFNNTF